MEKRRPKTKYNQSIPTWCWLVVFLLLCTYRSAAQKQEDLTPDGTQGEMLEQVKSDTLPQKWRDKRWRLFPGRFSTFKFGGGFLYEFAGFSPDQQSKQQMDSAGNTLEPTFSVRDFRITMSGQLRKTKRIITWKAGFMYDDAQRDWLVRETGVMVDIPEASGKVFIGRTKEGFSLNKVMVGYAGWTMERQMAIDVIPILADGVKWLGYLPKQRVLWNAGIYVDWLSHTQGFSTFHWQWALRVGWLPFYDEANNNVFHVAVNYRYGEPKNNQIKVRSRPEVDGAPFFIDTGVFPSSHSNQWGAEAYYKSGPFMIGSEVYMHKFSSPEKNDPVFYGGDAVVSYVLTGESRPYYTSTSIFGFMPVARPVFKGGPGAWEILFRASTYDLTNAALNGGKFWRITPMVNWYLSKEIRLELAYGYGVLDRFGLKGATQFFQSRIQLTLP